MGASDSHDHKTWLWCLLPSKSMHLTDCSPPPPPPRSGINYTGHNRSRFTDAYMARLAVPTVIPHGLPYTPVHMAVHSIVEHPNQQGDTFCCAKNHRTNG